MRTAILAEVHRQMKEDESIYFLTGDLGFGSLEEIERDFPNRFINIGIAEQNMIGIASGLALSGKRVYCYSIIPFLIMRAFEQIRNDICYHNLNVILLGVGAGLSYGVLSSTHFALTDLAITRVLPNMTVFSPADETEAVLGVKQLAHHQGPVYIRIGQKKEPVIYPEPYVFEFGKGHVITEGDKQGMVVFSTGPIIKEVIAGCALFEKETGEKVTIIALHTIKPLDKDLIIARAQTARAIITIEEHSQIGGLGGAVAETLAGSACLAKLTIIGTADEFIKEVGSQQYLRKIKRLNATGIFLSLLNLRK